MKSQKKLKLIALYATIDSGKTMLGITKKEKSTYITKTHFSKEIKVIYD